MSALPIRLRALDCPRCGRAGCDKSSHGPCEVNYVRASWMRSAKFGCMGARLGCDWQGYARLRDSLLRQHGAVVACSEDNPSSVVGWACLEGERVPVVHYVFVRQEFRRYGVARMMLGDDVVRAPRVYFTAMTDDSAAIRLPESWQWSAYRWVA